MIKVLVIKSSRTSLPLAEIRTDGKKIEFIIDNTEGSLPSQVGDSFQQLMNMVNNSSHLMIEEQQKPTIGLLRYMLDTGDVIEMTTDGKTAILNGSLLKEQEKNSLFAAIKRKEIKITSKTNIETPLPIFSSPAKIEQIKTENKLKLNLNLIKNLSDKNKKIEKIRKIATKDYDQELEEIAKKDPEDPKWLRELLYALKYGK